LFGPDDNCRSIKLQKKGQLGLKLGGTEGIRDHEGEGERRKWGKKGGRGTVEKGVKGKEQWEGERKVVEKIAVKEVCERKNPAGRL